MGQTLDRRQALVIEVAALVAASLQLDARSVAAGSDAKELIGQAIYPVQIPGAGIRSGRAPMDRRRWHQDRRREENYGLSIEIEYYRLVRRSLTE